MYCNIKKPKCPKIGEGEFSKCCFYCSSRFECVKVCDQFSENYITRAWDCNMFSKKSQDESLPSGVEIRLFNHKDNMVMYKGLSKLQFKKIKEILKIEQSDWN